jgi:hypothetical protein
LIEAFAKGFGQDFAGATTYDSSSSNKEFSDDLAKALGRDRIRILFSTGPMAGMNRFDGSIRYSPYLPGLEDKDCPEFAVSSQSLLGAYLEKSIEAMAGSRISVKSRTDVSAIAFRLWSACRQKKAPLSELSVSAWILNEHAADFGSSGSFADNVDPPAERKSAATGDRDAPATPSPPASDIGS